MTSYPPPPQQGPPEPGPAPQPGPPQTGPWPPPGMPAPMPPPAYPSYPYPPGPPVGWTGYRPVQLPNHPRAAAALTLGILSVACLSVLGPLAWYFGIAAMRDMDREPGRWQGRGQAKAGLILGIIGSAFLVMTILFLLLIVAGIAVVNGIDSGYPRP